MNFRTKIHKGADLRTKICLRLPLLAALVAGAPAPAQDVPVFLSCSGLAEYTFWAYERIQEAEGHEELAERIRQLRISSGVFVQAHVEDTGCDTPHDALRAVIQSEANLASGYLAQQMENGVNASDILAEYDLILDQCIADVGPDRFVRLMNEFAEQGPPCGWETGE